MKKIIENMDILDRKAKTESGFRSILLKEKLYRCESSMPKRLTEERVQAVPHSLDGVQETAASKKAKEKEHEKANAQPVSRNCFLDRIEDGLELTEQDVFNRLSISGLGEQVMACIDPDCDHVIMDEDDDGEDSDSSDVIMGVGADQLVKKEKKEVESDSQPLQDAQPAHDPIWRKAILKRLKLPHAHVQLEEKRAVPDELDPDKFRPTIEVKVYKIEENRLRAIEKKPKNRHRTLHPTLQASGVPLSTQNFIQAADDYTAFAIMETIADLVMMNRESSTRVQIFRQNQKGKTPISLQCRAQEAFAPRTLLLIPGNAWINFDKKKADTGDDKKSNIDKSMVEKLPGLFEEIVLDNRNKKMKQHVAAEPKIEFDLVSPLVTRPKVLTGIQVATSNQAAKDDDINTESVHPFWAVLKCMSFKSAHNMELSEETFAVPHKWCKGISKPLTQAVITILVLRNVVAIEENDVLTMPHASGEDDEVMLPSSDDEE